MLNKQTKIVATIGPASSSKEQLTQMIEAGMDVARLNFSHGSHEDHRNVIEEIKSLRVNLGSNTSLLADLQGPKIRIGDVGDGLDLIPGDRLFITSDEVPKGSKKIHINYASFAKDVLKGERILLDDGKFELKVISSNKLNEVEVEVIYGGRLTSNKGVNLPNSKISMPSLTEKDRQDLSFALEHNVDWIALSFVRSAKDVYELKDIIAKANKDCLVIAKIEKPEALDEIDEIIAASDALMVARGDLGVEIPMENVPLIQKMIIKKCIKNAKPVIVATQMMESMIENITPTRAEVNDVANAVLDGADAVMLSGETSVGKYPIEVIQNIAKIIKQIETDESIYHHEFVPAVSNRDRFISDSVCYQACKLAYQSNAAAIVTMTHSGYTALKISSSRPNAKIFAFTSNKSILTKLSLVWGVAGEFYDKMISTDRTIADIKSILKEKKHVLPGSLVINIASMPIADKGMSNMLKLSEII